jgi:hypothetical protein
MRWEYQVFTFDVTDVGALRDRLTELGEDEWELVTIVTEGGFVNALVVLKREIEELDDDDAEAEA